MAMRVQNLPKKNYDRTRFNVSCPSWWNSNEHQSSQSLSKNISFKVESSQLYHEAKHLGLQIPDQESSSIRSVGQSHSEMGGVGGTVSRDQCISSETGENENCEKEVDGKMKPVFLLSTRDIVFNPSQANYSHPMARATYPYADSYFGGLFTPYGPQAVIQPQMVGMTAARLPLPLDLADDEPIYVNAKQYHGILRRRQSRAKLEAQNKLVKTRKPYLHESRHLHALNRVRGSGGRFLSSKDQQPNATPASGKHGVLGAIHLHQKNDTSELESHHSGTVISGASNTTCSDVTSVSNSDAIFGQPGHRSSGISAHLGGGIHGNGRLMCGRT